MKQVGKIIRWVISRVLFVVLGEVFLGTIICIFLPELFIFPEVFSHPLGRIYGPTPNIDIFTVETSDGQLIDVWRLVAPGATHAAVISHGNGEVARVQVGIQYWLRELGITSYGYDYRGYGRSTGFPSEEGIYRDVEAVTQELVKRELIEPKNLVEIGISLGTGIAAYAAQKYKTGALVMFAPYSSIYDGAKEQFYARPFLSFLKIRIPTVEYVQNIPDTCIVMSRGEKDQLFSSVQTEKLMKSLQYHSKHWLIADTQADHLNIFPLTKDRVAEALTTCWIAGNGKP